MTITNRETGIELATALAKVQEDLSFKALQVHEVLAEHVRMGRLNDAERGSELLYGLIRAMQALTSYPGQVDNYLGSVRSTSRITAVAEAIAEQQTQEPFKGTLEFGNNGNNSHQEPVPTNGMATRELVRRENRQGMPYSEGWGNWGELNVLQRGFETLRGGGLAYPTEKTLMEAVYASILRRYRADGQGKEGRETCRRQMERNLQVLGDGMLMSRNLPPEERTIGWDKFWTDIETDSVLSSWTTEDLTKLLHRDRETVDRYTNLVTGSPVEGGMVETVDNTADRSILNGEVVTINVNTSAEDAGVGYPEATHEEGFEGEAYSKGEIQSENPIELVGGKKQESIVPAETINHLFSLNDEAIQHPPFYPSLTECEGTRIPKNLIARNKSGEIVEITNQPTPQMRKIALLPFLIDGDGRDFLYPNLKVGARAEKVMSLDVYKYYARFIAIFEALAELEDQGKLTENMIPQAIREEDLPAIRRIQVGRIFPYANLSMRDLLAVLVRVKSATVEALLAPRGKAIEIVESDRGEDGGRPVKEVDYSGLGRDLVLRETQIAVTLARLQIGGNGSLTHLSWRDACISAKPDVKNAGTEADRIRESVIQKLEALRARGAARLVDIATAELLQGKGMQRLIQDIISPRFCGGIYANADLDTILEQLKDEENGQERRRRSQGKSSSPIRRHTKDESRRNGRVIVVSSSLQNGS